MQDYSQQIIDSLTSGVIAADAEGRIITVNHAAIGHLHTSEDDLRPETNLDAVPLLRPMAEVFEEVKRTGEPITRRELLLSLPEGDTKEIGLSASLLERDGGFGGVIFLFIDMTDRRNQERAAELNRQLAELGELTAGVVHELRNPVSVISGMAELLLRKLPPGDERRATAETIFREAEDLERSISQFLGFARPFDLTPGPCSPREIAERAMTLCRRRGQAKSVELSCTCGDEIPLIEADRERIAQALANIVNNGIDAVPHGGTVALAVSEDDDDVVFEIVDNGPGIHLSPKESLFSPFLTKKEGGTGLGLTIVHRIVTAHKGTVRYGNREQGGARFVVRIPRSLHPAPPIAEREF
ncbi:MAG: PAS domain-containing protein [Candidatus Hydrogenedentes bacterium]|nr:PAS domain-containing protein [Candidatus Hydrogenedentota bacterium]